ncbi:MAG: hypothetical protein HZA20_13635 [Nitrospirae bacterium]|nr:hypothetical protein [Nitrospirota bacterium]
MIGGGYREYLTGKERLLAALLAASEAMKQAVDSGDEDEVVSCQNRRDALILEIRSLDGDFPAPDPSSTEAAILQDKIKSLIAASLELNRQLSETLSARLDDMRLEGRRAEAARLYEKAGAGRRI